MTKHTKISDEDLALFRSSFKGAKTLKQDTVVHSARSVQKPQLQQKRQLEDQANETFYFSDEYQPLLKDDPIRYSRANADPYEVKKLRRGDYAPELFLDLHGLTQEEAKKELGALLAACRREHVYCACVMYGHGKHILKKQTPRWLAQHPNVLCFHQAPKEYGGTAALLVLVELDEHKLLTVL